MNRERRVETKIALVLFALTMVVSHFMTIPEFVMGFSFAIYIVLMVIGLIPEKNYKNLRERQEKKLQFVKAVVRADR